MAEVIRIERTHNPKLKEPNSNGPERHGKIGQILSFVAKFAFDSVVNPSLKVSTGGEQVNKVEQEELKDQPFPPPFNDKNKPRDLKLVMEKIQEDMNNRKQHHKISDENLLVKVEKMQEDMNDVKQQHKVLAKCVEESESSKKKQEEDVQGYDDLLRKNRKRVFIRSRL
ncbi:hypothetical protein PanWU01x14_265800 [Parasponia andersonii]|uniref:Uncharacterized protein n=1 Tax=Parasponia andersonii TaxID=3476 RepID=A0A2P5B752_PARAD|nr:hypothetical protein PanWU01x14_265800 [Parasponia andersonii]